MSPSGFPRPKAPFRLYACFSAPATKTWLPRANFNSVSPGSPSQNAAYPRNEGRCGDAEAEAAQVQARRKRRAYHRGGAPYGPSTSRQDNVSGYGVGDRGYRRMPKCSASIRLHSSSDLTGNISCLPFSVTFSSVPVSVIRPVKVASEQILWRVKGDAGDVW